MLLAATPGWEREDLGVPDIGARSPLGRGGRWGEEAVSCAPGQRGVEMLQHREGKRRRKVWSKTAGGQQVPRGLGWGQRQQQKLGVVVARGRGGLRRGRVGMVSGNGRGGSLGWAEMRCGSWRRLRWQEAALLSRTTCFQNKQTLQKKSIFSRVFFCGPTWCCAWAVAPCPTWGEVSWGKSEDKSFPSWLQGAGTWHLSLRFHRALLGAGGFLGDLEKLLGIFKFLQGKEKGCRIFRNLFPSVK